MKKLTTFLVFLIVLNIFNASLVVLTGPHNNYVNSTSVFALGWIGDNGRVFDAKAFAERYATAFQTGNIDALLRMYAPSVTVKNQVQTKEQIKSILSKSAKSLNSAKTIQKVTPIAYSKFTENAPGKFSGKITFQITYLEKGATKTNSIDVGWTVARQEGGGEWLIINTDKLGWDWGN